MQRLAVYIFVFLSAAAICITACVHKPQISVTPSNGNFPDSIASIILNKCTNSGCHNPASYQNAGDLLLDSWQHMLQGSSSGAVVVAYSAKYSTLLSYCNNGFDPGTVNAYDTNHFRPITPITAKEYATLKNWVAGGAPDNSGNIPFATNADTRQKIYLAMSTACNQVAVIDAQSKLVMRYITVGDNENPVPHDVEVSHDGNFAYVSLYSGSYVQKIDTRTDTVVSTANLNSAVPSGSVGFWSIINLSPSDTALMVTGWTSPGYVVTLNTASMTINEKMSIDVNSGGTSSFLYPHGVASNATFDTFFVALQKGNVVNKFSFPSTGFYLKQVPIKGTQAIVTSNPTTPDPHQLEMLPDHSRYFVTCQTSNEVRVMDAYSDVILDSIPVGAYPQEMAISTSKGYLFVACMLDKSNPTPGSTGSVYVIDYTTHKVVTTLYGDFSQPHDIAVDEQDGLVFICSTNQGGTSHHSPLCGGVNGWYTVYDLNTLKPDNKRYEVLAFPYTLSTRFK